MNGKTKLKIIQILCIISLIITVFSIQRTYARYFEKVETKYDTNIKRWVINVNETNIHGKKNELTSIMQPTFRANAHMNNNNTLVPGREGYFDFVIDYSKVDLAFRFDFDIKQQNTKIVDDGETEEVVDDFLEDFEIYGYSIVETNASTGVETETPTILETVNDLSGLTQTIDPTDSSDTEKKLHLRILFRWNDTNKDTEDTDDKLGMNNNEDTQYVYNHDELNYKVKIIFTQQL